MVNSTEDIIRILYVDDDPSIRHISQIMLKDIESKFDIDTANSVDEAFEKLSAENNYDIIISDYEMPLKNGLDFLKELKEKKIKISFVLFTGKGREEIAIKALNMGADGYYNKQGDPETVYGELSHGLTMVVKRRRAELQLIESEKKENAILSNAPIGIVTSDSDKYFLTANKAFCSILGYSEEELRKLTFKDFTYSEDLTESISNMEKLTSGEIESFTQEKRYIRKDGAIIDGKVTVSATRDETGKPTLFVAILEDITQRKEKDKELIKKELAIDSMLSSSNSPIFMVDRNYCYTAFNVVHSEVMKQLYGAEISLGKSLLDYMTNTGDRIIARTNIDRALAGEFVEDEKPSGDLGFNRVWFSVRHYPVRNDSGQVEGVSVFAVDLTKSKQAEEKSKINSILFESASDSIFVHDLTGKFLFFNQTTCKTRGYTPEELSQMSVKELDSPNCPNNLEQGMKSLMEKGEIIIDRIHRCKDGSELPVELHSRLITLGDQKLVLTVARDIIERKNTEEELKRKKQELQLIIDSSPTIIFYKDLNGKILQVNKAFAKSINTIKKKLIGKTVFDLYSPEIAQSMTDDDHIVFKTKRPKLGIVEPYDSPTGLRWIRTSKIPTFNDNGEVTGLIGFSEDITEQKRAEDTLRQSKLILENSSDSIIVTDIQGNITSWNKGAENIFGYTSTEMVGQPITKVVKAQEKEEASKQIDDIRNDKTFGQAWEGVKKDGSTVWLMLTTKLLKNEKDEPIAMVGFGKDITEYKKAEEALRESEERYRLLYQTAGVGVGYYTIDGKVISFNEIALQHMGGLKLSDVVNKSIFELFPKEDAEVYFKRITSAYQQGKSLEFTDFLGLPSGKMWFLSVFSCVKNSKGEVIGIQIMSVDISKQKLADIEVVESHRKIETINEKLLVVGSLTRHDVGNKLMAAKSNMYLLRKKLKDNSDLLKYVDAVDEAFNQSDKIFEFSKIYERIGVEKPIVVDVADMFDEASKLVSHPNVEVVNMAQGLSVVADSMLQRLFYNLIDNSLKHGKHVSRIQLSVKREKKEEIKLVYEDNGVGVSQQNKLKIFAEGFTTGGSGLGLKLVKRMVEVYGWTIAETGEEGKGARFEITISPH